MLSTRTYKTGDIDFTTQLTQIKALNPDVLFVSALPPEKPLILVQAREVGISVPILISSLTEAEVRAAGAAAEGANHFHRMVTYSRNTRKSEVRGNSIRKVYGTETQRICCCLLMHVSMCSLRLRKTLKIRMHSQYETHWRVSKTLIRF